MLSLTVSIRDKKANLDKLRSEGLIPAVYYGKKESSTPISIKRKDFLKVWQDAGESTVVILKTPNGELESLIHDIDIDPVSDAPVHADFYVFEKGKKLEVSVPIEFIGVSPAVKDLGGILVKVLHEINIEAEPKNLPHSLTVDISSLSSLDSVILAKEIKLPAGVSLIENPEEVVASISVAKEEVEEEPVDLSQIEVEKKGKEEPAPEEAESQG